MVQGEVGVTDEEPLEVTARVVGTRRLPPTRDVTSDLHGGRFDRHSTMVAFEAVTVSDVSFAGMRFQEFSARGGCVFSGCDFSRVRSRYVSHLSPALPQTVYRDCRFDRADLREFFPGSARFERCRFDHARLDGWRSDLAEFIDCYFAGKVSNVIFWGRPYGILAEELEIDRPVNEFRGNDFRQAEVRNCLFVLGIDLDGQRWPEGPAYIRLDRLGERLRRVRAEVIRWTDLEARRDALIMLEVLQEAVVDQDQDDLFMDRATLGEDNPDVAEEVWDLLATAE
jgi:hypothetical protein